MTNTQPELIDLSDTGYTDDELFEMTGQDLSAVEKIDAPKYSYWKSVWRVFFRKKSNIVIIILTLIILVFTYIYPMFSGFDKYQNIMDLESRHLSPSKAFAKYGFSIHWLFGTGGSGQSTFDGLWYGARISITIALICTLINFGIGILLGAVWGFSKRVDMIMNEESRQIFLGRSKFYAFLRKYLASRPDPQPKSSIVPLAGIYSKNLS